TNANQFITVIKCSFLDVFVDILSLTVKIDLPLQLSITHFFASGQTCEIGRGSNTYFPHCMCLCVCYFFVLLLIYFFFLPFPIHSFTHALIYSSLSLALTLRHTHTHAHAHAHTQAGTYIHKLLKTITASDA